MMSTQKPDDIINIVSTLKKFNEKRNFFSSQRVFPVFGMLSS